MWSNPNHIHRAATPRQVKSSDEAVEKAMKLVLAKVEHAGGEVAQVLKHREASYLHKRIRDEELGAMVAKFIAWSVLADAPDTRRVDLFRLSARLRAHLQVA
jgi:hypothetical protein